MPHLLTLSDRTVVIVIAMLKGGSGKTTSAVLTALYYARQGLDVDLLDGDHTSQSAYDWARIAAASGTPLPFQVERFPYTNDIAAELRQRRAASPTKKRIIVDAGGGDAMYLEEAASEADILISTLAPSAADARRVDATLKAAERGAERNPRGLLTTMALVRADHRTSQPRRWRNQLKADGRPLLDTSIGARVLYSDAYGTCPDDVGEYAPLLAEVETDLVVPA